MKLSRLRGRKTCDFLLRKGKVWRGNTMRIHWLLGAPRKPDIDRARAAIYVGTFASAKLHKSAVKRNRMRRRCREALRRAVRERDTLPAVQLLMTPRSSSLTCAFRDIEDDVNAFLSLL